MIRIVLNDFVQTSLLFDESSLSTIITGVGVGTFVGIGVIVGVGKADGTGVFVGFIVGVGVVVGVEVGIFEG